MAVMLALHFSTSRPRRSPITNLPLRIVPQLVIAGNGSGYVGLAIRPRCGLRGTTRAIRARSEPDADDKCLALILPQPTIFRIYSHATT